MGLEVCKLSIFEGNKDITKDHPIIVHKNFFIPKYYSPWGFKGENLCLVKLNSGTIQFQAIIYSIIRKIFISPVKGDNSIIICSPNTAQVMMSSYDVKSHSSSPCIVNLNGKIEIDIPLSVKPTQLFISWLKDSSDLIIIACPINEVDTWLYYIEGTSGKLIEKIPLDPSRLVPYEKEKYQSIDNENLPVASKDLAFGGLLNEWSDIRYNLETKILTLTFNRPVGNVFIQNNEEKINIQEFAIHFRIEIEE